jgi:hypothetical protein
MKGQYEAMKGQYDRFKNLYAEVKGKHIQFFKLKKELCALFLVLGRDDYGPGGGGTAGPPWSSNNSFKSL